MELSANLKEKGFKLCDVEASDFAVYYEISRACYEGYVNAFFGGWDETRQIEMNRDAFQSERNETCFQKIMLHGSTVGFFAFDVQDDKIDGVMIQMLEPARNQGLGSFYLNHLVTLSDRQQKPVFLRVFMTNPAQELYQKFGFAVYDKTISHYLMRYDPKSDVRPQQKLP